MKKAILVTILITLFIVAVSTASDCTRVDDATKARVAAYVNGPSGGSAEVVREDPVGDTCYSRLVAESVTQSAISAAVLYLSPDRHFISHDLANIDSRNQPPIQGPGDIGFTESATSSKGSPDAKVTVVEFSDFECPYCKVASKLLAQFSSYPDVRVVYRHLPLPFHPWSLFAARATSCAGSPSEFWKLHDFYFDSQQEITATNVAAKTYSFVKSIGRDPKEFENCVSSSESLDAVRRDVRDAAVLGIRGTPTIYANGKRLRPAQSIDDLKKQIETASGVALRGPSEAQTFLVLMKPTDTPASRETEEQAAAFLNRLQRDGVLVSAGHAQSTDSSQGYEVLTIRANNAAEAWKLISVHPLIVKHVAKPEFLAWHPSVDSQTP